MKLSILYVEDEVETSKIVKRYLEKAGYKVHLFNHGNTALRALHCMKFDIAIFDIMLPGTDGISLLKQAVSQSIPSIMVTARTIEADRIHGLDLGADDYVCKPFSPRELVSRATALGRRTAPRIANRNYVFGDYCLAVEGRTLSLNNQHIPITAIEYELLITLAQKGGRVFSRRELMDMISKDNLTVSERTLDTHILNLRKKIESDRRKPRWIITAFGVGYKFSQEVKCVDSY
jgi:DNA-binding response OmpR family regulator